jgi:hypothetical protein
VGQKGAKRLFVSAQSSRLKGVPQTNIRVKYSGNQVPIYCSPNNQCGDTASAHKFWFNKGMGAFQPEVPTTDVSGVTSAPRLKTWNLFPGKVYPQWPTQGSPWRFLSYNVEILSSVTICLIFDFLDWKQSEVSGCERPQDMPQMSWTVVYQVKRKRLNGCIG